jgi:alkylation response protein AidB-like acyl-CoA dehydrogenase
LSYCWQENPVYRAPLKDLLFVLNDVVDAPALGQLPRFAEFSADLAESVLAEAGRFAAEVLDPLNRTGDVEGARWTPEGVRTAKGFADAYHQYASGGWTQLGVATEVGGQGMPLALGTAVEEIGCGANTAFMLCPLLARGAIEAIALAGSPQLRECYLPKLVSGVWTGTMNLTEPQAGSDLAAIRTRAEPRGDHHRIFGQKIFITYGDHDMAENIVHLVLARIDGAPAGIKGISLFVVPKRLPRADGSPGEANDLRCASIEHKLGIHGSPTCVMAFGDKDGAVGYLVGEPNRGLEYMFIMMNAARLGVGVQGIGLGERAFQAAAEWARTRVQGRLAGVADATPVPIIQHPDVRRMLLGMKATIESLRALALYTAVQLDRAHAAQDPKARAAALARGELLIPIVKAWSTEQGVEIASAGVQVHGGMGYIEETGAAQILRDVRITAIYEGTTAIQANDLVGRKLARDGGASMSALLDEIEAELKAAGSGDATARHVAAATLDALALLRITTRQVMQQFAASVPAALAVAVPYLKLCGCVLGGWLGARAATRAAARLAAGGADVEFLRAKLQSTRFYADQVLPQARAFAEICRGGAASVLESQIELI